MHAHFTIVIFVCYHPSAGFDDEHKRDGIWIWDDMIMGVHFMRQWGELHIKFMEE